MKSAVRILIVLAIIAFIALVGLVGVVWANRLMASLRAPTATAVPTTNPTNTPIVVVPTVGVSAQDFNAQLDTQGRQQGTVDITPTCLVTKDPGELTVGSVATWLLNQVGGVKVYKACVTKQKLLPAAPPSGLLSYPIELTVAQGPTLGVDERVCFPIPLGVAASAY